MRSLMTISNLSLSLVLGIALHACTPTGSSPNTSASTNPSNSTGIANPAATFCEQRNGKHVIRKTSLGEVGYCVFTDRSACEEWSFFQGQCKMGDKPDFQ